jgi:hypothetical protein
MTTLQTETGHAVFDGMLPALRRGMPAGGTAGNHYFDE